jgi:hypothetical protein
MGYQRKNNLQANQSRSEKEADLQQPRKCGKGSKIIKNERVLKHPNAVFEEGLLTCAFYPSPYDRHYGKPC